MRISGRRIWKDWPFDEQCSPHVLVMLASHGSKNDLMSRVICDLKLPYTQLLDCQVATSWMRETVRLGGHAGETGTCARRATS
jgi:hypothetical protein